MLFPCVLLGMMSIALGIGAEGMLPYIEDAAYTLMNPEVYVNAVLGNGE